MAGPEDFFSPGEWFDPSQLAVPPAVQQGFENPHLRAAATQFGLNLLAGGGWGGGFGQDLARAVGGAGEAVGRGEAMDTTQRKLDIAQQEADSKSEARSAKMEAQAKGLENSLLRTQLAGEQNDATKKLRATQAYQTYVNNVTRANSDAAFLPGAPQQPILPFEQWVVKNPLLKGLFPELANPPAPNATPTPAPTTATPAATQPPTRPPVPKGVPSDALYSPSRKQWRDKKGQLYNEAGQRIQTEAPPSLEGSP